MRWWRLPGISWGLPFVLGTAAALGSRPYPLLALSLLGAALALGGGSGRSLALVAVGLLSAWLRPAGVPEVPARIDVSRPLEVRARLEGPWRPARFGSSGRLTVDTVRQGPIVEVWPARIAVGLGSSSPPARRGDLVLKGFLRRAPPLGNQPPQPAGPWRLLVKSRRLVEERVASRRRTASGWSPRPAIERLFDQAPSRSSGLRLARALVLGDPSWLDRDVTRGLRRLGLGHLLAVSGLHVGIAGLAVWWLSRPLPRPFRLAAPVVAAGAYLALIGPRPSIVRASVMVLLAAWSLATGRKPEGANSLGWALGLILLLDPAAAAELGFALTAAATAGIVLLAPSFDARWRDSTWLRIPGAVRNGLAASAGAQLGALPWTLSVFHMVTPLTALLNLLAVPWTALTLTASFVWVALSFAAPALAFTMTPVLDLLAEPFGWCGLPTPRLALLWPSAVGWLGGLVASIALASALLARRRGGQVVSLAVAVLVFTWPGSERGREVVMLDVGQGDAILIRDGGHAALVDGGGWRQLDIAQRVLVPTLARLGVRRLDALVLSHSDLDHCRGLVELASYLPVAEIWSATGLPQAGCAAELIRVPGPRWRPLWRGRVGAVGRWRLETLHPSPGSAGTGNEQSLVVRATSGGRSVLLTGDIGARGEREVLGRVAPGRIRSEVLKIAHHGSKNSTSTAFLQAVEPRLALVSAGRHNSYGHPSTVIVDRLERHGVRLLRTDRDGMIRVMWPGR